MNSMNLLGKFFTNFRDFYKEINAATLTGAIDVVVVEQPDGTYTCSPFHVRFGKLGVLRAREKIVDIEINGEPLDIHMKLGESGEAFFVEEVFLGEDGDEEEIPPHLACSPIPSHDQLDQWMKEEDIKEEEQRQGQFAKVFVAETIGNEQETVRKLSIAAGEFRPIEGKADSIEPGKEIKERESGELSSSSTSQGQPTQGQSQGGKRKRRKKSSLKRRGSQSQNAQIGALAQSGKPVFRPEETSVFTIDDVSSSANISANSDIVEAEIQRLNLGNGSSLADLQRLPADNDYHFFSDTELTSGCSPESRPSSPIASDTELEQRRHHENDVEDAEAAPQSWKWGELPSPPPRPSSASGKMMTSTAEEEAAKKQERSMLSGMFSFMKKTKHLRHGQQEGVYLSDLNAEDPEVAALYFPHYRNATAAEEGEGHREDDAESGNGPSIPHSPTSQSPPTICSDWSTQRIENQEVSMSLCGHLDSGVSDELFNQCLVRYDDLIANPMLIDHPDLVVRIGSKFYNWRMACPLVMSVALFRRPLPQPVVEILSDELMPASKLKELKDKSKPSSYYSWFTWRRSTDPTANPSVTEEQTKKLSVAATESEAIVIAMPPTPLEEEKSIQQSNEAKEKENEEGYAGSNSSEDSDTGPSQTQTKLPKERRFYQQSDKCRKTLRLSSEQIARLNLLDGANEVEFSVTTAYQGTTRCKCHIYKWRYDDKIVISDIDGTITKSDVLGHVLPIVGKDWAQSGVAQLFTKIKNNGYKLLYLSARAIGQARVTREYLRSIKQGDLSLPDGPLLLNPTSLISAFHREVIERKPEEFKISCLRDIAALFPIDVKPFYAGYGNRVNDVWAYRAVGIPIVRIFTINYKGELKHELTQTFQSSYSSMCHMVDEVFPTPMEEDLAEDYSNFVYWRDPLPDIDFSESLAVEKP